MPVFALLFLMGLAFVLAPKKAVAFVKGEPTNIILVPLDAPNDSFQLRADAARAWNRMARNASEAGISLRVNSAFRTNEEQAELWVKYQTGQGNLAARPGFSSHQSGTAVDVDVDASFTSPTYKWLEGRASYYGFVNTGKHFKQSEPWHWEFV